MLVNGYLVCRLVRIWDTKQWELIMEWHGIIGLLISDKPLDMQDFNLNSSSDIPVVSYPSMYEWDFLIPCEVYLLYQMWNYG